MGCRTWVLGESYTGVVKQRGIDLGNKVLQVFSGPTEHKMSKSGEDSACWRRWTRVTGKYGGFEFDGEPFEFGHHNQVTDHRRRRNIPITRDIRKGEADEVGCRQVEVQGIQYHKARDIGDLGQIHLKTLRIEDTSLEAYDVPRKG